MAVEDTLADGGWVDTVALLSRYNRWRDGERTPTAFSREQLRNTFIESLYAAVEDDESDSVIADTVRTWVNEHEYEREY